MGATVAEKILARASVRASVRPGDIVEPAVDLAMSHENAALVINQFHEIYNDTGLAPRVWDPSRIAIIFDHRVPAESAKTATNQKRIREFVTQHDIEKFHEIRGDEGGICHQILPENGYVRPGTVVVGTDSHTTTHGALGAVAWGIGATEMAAVWTLGFVPNVEVPATIKVVIDGELPAWVGPKDVILALIGQISAAGANFRVLEFHGETARRMTTSGRLVLSNMAVEAGATAGIFPADEETLRYLREEAGVSGDIPLVEPDKDAEYESVVTFDVASLDPQIACPHTVDNVKPVGAVEGTPRESNRRRLMHEWPTRRSGRGGGHPAREEGGALDPHARLPGVRPNLPPGVGARLHRRSHECRGRGHELRLRLLSRYPPRRARRRRGRPLHDEPQFSRPDGQPDRRGLSLLTGCRGCLGPHRHHHRSKKGRAQLMAKVAYKLGNDISTDVIYPGRYMATVLPTETPQYAFADLKALNAALTGGKVESGSVIVAGSNFGCGSSREQAASCLKGHGLVIVAKSIARIFLQNAVNLGLRDLRRARHRGRSGR